MRLDNRHLRKEVRQIVFYQVFKPDKADDTVIIIEALDIIEPQKPRKNTRNLHPGKLERAVLLIFKLNGKVQ